MKLVKILFAAVLFFSIAAFPPKLGFTQPSDSNEFSISVDSIKPNSDLDSIFNFQKAKLERKQSEITAKVNRVSKNAKIAEKEIREIKQQYYIQCCKSSNQKLLIQ